MALIRVGNLSPRRQQKVIANVRAGQSAFNQLMANLRREEQIVNNIEKAEKERRKFNRLFGARIFVHPGNSNASRRNNEINARLERNIKRMNQEIQRHQANLVALRRRVLGIATDLSNHNVLTYVNHSGHKANINRMQKKRLARLITGAYLKPGGMYSRKLVNNVRSVA